MRILSIFLSAISIFLIGFFTDSPHGEKLKISCSECHGTNGWKLDKTVYSFNHSTTKLPLVGQHKNTDCKMCHTSLVFSDAKSECSNCHSDVHEATVGLECNQCHTPNSWLVPNITKIHQRSRFPLLGVHSTVDCYQCHKSATFLKFEVLGTECYNCHSNKYDATTQPSHLSAGYSKNCNDCHNIFSSEWKGAGFNHKFFPLSQGHSISNCATCHTNSNYKNLSKACITCHQAQYNGTKNPVHATSNFPTTCETCHTIAVGWKPATFADHNKYFPSNHGGSGSVCSECHENPANYKSFTCITCHTQTSTNKEHKGESGYQFNSTSCLRCHPNGSSD